MLPAMISICNETNNHHLRHNYFQARAGGPASKKRRLEHAVQPIYKNDSDNGSMSEFDEVVRMLLFYPYKKIK